MKGDVTETERRHHGERPIEACDPSVFLTLAQHQDVEQDAVGDDEAQQDQQKLDEGSQIDAVRSVFTEGGEDGGKGFHERGATGRDRGVKQSSSLADPSRSDSAQRLGSPSGSGGGSPFWGA